MVKQNARAMETEKLYRERERRRQSNNNETWRGKEFPMDKNVPCQCAGCHKRFSPKQAEFYVYEGSQGSWVVQCPECGVRVALNQYQASGKAGFVLQPKKLLRLAMLVVLLCAIAFLWKQLGNMQGKLDIFSTVTNLSKEEEQKREGARYQLYMGDKTWSEAEQFCEEQGGHLAYLKSQSEYNTVVDMLEGAMDAYDMKMGDSSAKENLYYVWLGAKNESGYEQEKNEFQWLDGDRFSKFEDKLWWYIETEDGSVIYEPSYHDVEFDELYLCLWAAHYDEHQEGNLRGWTFNDQSNDIVKADYNASGRIGFICEWDSYTYDYETERDSILKRVNN